MSDYKESLKYIREMKEPGNTILGVNHDHIPKYFPMEQQDEESKLLYGLKGIAAGGVTGGLVGATVQASNYGVPGKELYAVGLGAGIGATAGLARNLIEHGRREREREKNQHATNKKKKV